MPVRFSCSAADEQTSQPNAFEARILTALGTVQDPELRQDLISLGMISSVEAPEQGGSVRIGLLYTISSCPKKSELSAEVRAAVAPLLADEAAASGAPRTLEIHEDVMSPAQRQELVDRLRGGVRNPFAAPDSLTRVIAVASGKGGVGKSTVTANLALALAARGLSVAVIDADIHGFSLPKLLGVSDSPTRVGEMMIPPRAHGLQVMSIGMFVGSDQPITWRGPMLHRALEQFLTDTYFGDVDVLLLDLPPGTGDIPITVAQLLPGSGLLVVTTPHDSAAEVAERAGAMASQTGQKVLGVVENMSWIEHEGARLTPFGTGGGQQVADALTSRFSSEGAEAQIPLLAQIPLREGIRSNPPDGVHAPEFAALAQALTPPRGLAGRSLPLSF